MNRSRSDSDAATPSYNELLDRNQDLQRAVEELSLLNDLAGEIGASFNSGYILKRIIDRSRRATDAGQAVISLVDRNAPDPARTVCRAMDS